ncbi:ribosome maturation factor RimM [Micromonospora sp. ATA32]|nr:ribosome maturation factor RimM [Micromonospora sp. ATA32]
MLLIVGRIGKPHGIRGAVTVEVRTDEPEARFAPGAVLRTEPGVPYQVPAELTIESARWHQGRMLVAFEGVLDRETAEALRGTLIGVDRATVAPPEDPEEFHDHQLVGLAVVTPTGERLGEVARIDHTPASDLLVLRRPEGRTALIPFVRAIVPEVDLAGGRVVVDPPAGLLDL